MTYDRLPCVPLTKINKGRKTMKHLLLGLIFLTSTISFAKNLPCNENCHQIIDFIYSMPSPSFHNFNDNVFLPAMKEDKAVACYFLAELSGEVGNNSAMDVPKGIECKIDDLNDFSKDEKENLKTFLEEMRKTIFMTASNYCLRKESSKDNKLTIDQALANIKYAEDKFNDFEDLIHQHLRVLREIKE